MAFTIDKDNWLAKNPFKMYGVPDLTETLKPPTPQVNYNLKPIDRSDANMEVEKGEVALSADGNLYNVRGKSHAQGGTPVNLPDGSFIFSNHKPLAIGKEDKKLFQFKDGGTYKQKNNTPAKIVKREVNVEHHNKMVAISSSDDHDDISKNSAGLMLQKNFGKLGQVAYLQEEKKGFPDGLPGVSDGTAPVMNNQLQKEVDVQKQYKAGGFVPLKRRQVGGWKPFIPRTREDDKATLSTLDDKYMDGIPSNSDILQYDELSQEIFPSVRKYYPFYTQRNGHAANFYQDYQMNNGDLLNNNGLPNPPVAQTPVATTSTTPTTPMVANSRRAVAGCHPSNPDCHPSRRRLLTPPSTPDVPLHVTPPTPIDDPNFHLAPPDQPQQPFVPGTRFNPPVAQKQPDSPILPYNPQVPLTPDQKLSLGYDAYNAASVRRFFPKREQMSFTPVNLQQVSDQPYLNQVDASVAEAYRSNQAFDPIQARAQNAELFGKALQQRSQIEGNVANQNSQISNQQALYNNEGFNRNNAQNVQLDNNYYNQVQALNQNFDNEKRFAWNRVQDKYMQYRSQDDALQMELASQPTYGTKDVWRDKQTGKISNTPVEGWDKVRQAAPLYDYNARNNSVYFTGAGMNMDQLPDNTASYKDMLFKSLVSKFNNGTITKEELRTLGYITRGIK